MFTKNHSAQLFKEVTERFLKKIKQYICDTSLVGTETECHRQSLSIFRLLQHSVGLGL